MKRIIIILLSVFFCIGFAQQQPVQKQVLQLGSFPEPSAEMLDLSKFTNVNQTITLNNDRFVINVQFHSVKNTDSSNPSNIALGEMQAFKVLARLNEVFNEHNIFFKYRGLTTINNSNLIYAYDQSSAIAIKQQFINQNKYDINSINIFMTVDDYNYSNFLNNYDIFGSDNTDIILHNAQNNPVYHKGLIPALIGRSLGLLQVYRGSSEYSNPNQTFTPPCSLATLTPYILKPTIAPTIWINAENVTRNIASPFYNATTKGDLVADTQACFWDAPYNYCYNFDTITGAFNLNDFIYHPSVKDQVNAPYECTSNEGNNYLGPSTPFIGNNGLFTPGQVQRMKEYIEGNMDNIFRKKLNVFEDDSPDISVLYEPFAINDGGTNSNSTNTVSYSRTQSTNDTFTGANVWNCGPFLMRWQTGFNCEFTSVINGVSTNFSKTIYQQFNSTNATCLRLKIPILSPIDVYDICEPVCFSSFEPFTSGDVKSLNNLGLGIYTQEQLDEIKASDPNLYEKLQSGKYHIVTKQTNSGFTDQKIIYKN